MPVLWAGPDGSGQTQSGIERAKVTVDDAGSGFALDLDDVDAKKAGPQWRAATASAAAVATIASAKDPSTVGVRYTITGAIDGPSGGAILTVGTLAAMRGDSLSPDVTMTGTISPDGTVGRVGDIPAKLRAASKAGFRVVLLPTTNLVATGESSTTDMVAYGSSMGLEVRGVDLLTQAYAAFTGVSLIGTVTQPATVSAPVLASATSTTRALLDRLRTESAANSTASNESGIAARDLADAERAFAAGDVATAYGLGVDGYTVLQRAIGTAKVNATIASKGLNAARDEMRAEVAALRTSAAEILLSGSDVANADVVTQLTTPFALGWATYADALLVGIDDGLASGSITAVGYAMTGAVIAEQRAAIEVFQPDALIMSRAAPNAGVTTARPPAEFLSGYTDFLVRAGRANADYYDAVVTRNRVSRTDAKGNPAFTVLALEALTRASGSIPSGVQAVDDEIRQSALAVTYFVIGTGLVANTTDKGIAGSGIGADAISTIDIPGLIASVDESAQLVNDYAVGLAARSIDASGPLWSSQWGVATATALNGSGRDAMGEVIAQNELWYDVIGMASMWAATTPR